MVLDAVLGPLTQGSIPPARLQLAREAPLPDLQKPDCLPAKELLTNHRRIGLVPAQFAVDGPRAKAAPRYHVLIAEQLRNDGYDVVVDKDIDGAWDAERNAAGGFYDPQTGAFDEVRWEVSRRRGIADFRRRNDVDAVIIPEFESVFAPVAGGMAQWDGAKALALVMASKGLGKYMNFDAVLAGSLPAVSLKLYVIDGHERELLVGSGGIHLTQRIDKGRIVEVPEAELFTIRRRTRMR